MMYNTSVAKRQQLQIQTQRLSVTWPSGVTMGAPIENADSMMCYVGPRARLTVQVRVAARNMVI